MANIFEITTEYQQLLDEIELNEGVLTDEMIAKIDVNRENLNDKINGYVQVIKNFELEISTRNGTIDKYQTEIELLQAKNNSDSRTIERMKQAIDSTLKIFELSELKTPLFKISYRKSEKTIVTDESLLPKFCFKTEKVTKRLGLSELKALIESGKIKQGAEIITVQNLQLK